MTTTPATTVLGGLDALRPSIEKIHRDLHQHPELSYAAHRTSALVTERLRAAGCGRPAAGGHRRHRS